MAVFSYLGRDKAGRQQRGTQEAVSAGAVAESLRQRGWLVLEVRPDQTGAKSSVGVLARLNPFYWLGPRSLDIELGLQQLAVMLRSGLTLLAILKTLAENSQRPSMRLVWENVAVRIQQGSSLADAMAAHKCFGYMVVQLVRVGEQTGTLEKVVTRAAEAMERRRLLLTQLLTALFYPALVLVLAIAVTVYMLTGVIPKLRVFLSAIGRTMPPMTQRLLDLSDFVVQYGPGIGIGLAVFMAVMIAIYLWPPGRMVLDRLVLRVPLVGRLLRLSATAQFSHALGVMLESGITVVEGLRTVERLHKNRYVALQAAHARESVVRGSGLAEPLGAANVFMPMLPQMVAVGETAGTLDEVLAEVAKFNEMLLQITIRRFSTLIEPAITIVVGAIVGYVYIAFFMALFAAGGGAH